MKLLSREGIQVTTKAVSKWETNSREPALHIFLTLCQLLDVEDIYEAFFGENPYNVMSGLNEEGKNKIIEFVQKRGWDQLEHPECLIKSISIEAGELLECIQWDNDYKTENISEELADVMIYCFQLAYSLNLDVSTIIEKKLIKNAEKYPVKEF